MALMLHCGSLLGTLLTIVNRCIDAISHMGPVVFQSHLVVYPAMSGVPTQNWMMGQVHETDLV